MTTTTVKRFTATGTNDKAAAFTVDSQIMDYIEPARTFGAGDLAEVTASRRYQPTVVALPDHRQAPVGPMVLTLGNNERLRLVRRVPGGRAGLSANWETIDLSAGFAQIARGRVTAFAAAWTAADAITVAVAVESDDESRRSRILIAYDLSSRRTDWSKIPWINYGSRDRLVIDGMRVVREPDGTWMTVMSAGGDGVLKNTHVIRQGSPESFQDHGLVYSTATDVVDIADFQVGAIRDGAALHVLGANHDHVGTLLSRKVPVLAPGGTPVATPVLTFGCPEGARRLALGLAREKRGADLYVGGSGVWRLGTQEFGRQEYARFQAVIPAGAAEGVEHLVVAEAEDGAATVWALDGQGRVVMTSRRAGQADWEVPLPLRSGVREIAPVPGDRYLTSSVLVVYQTGRASHLWRDVQGVWQEEAIVVADTDRASNVVTFQTVVTLLDENEMPRGGAKVRIGASVASTLVVNGRSHFVCPGHDAVVTAPFDGRITIVNRALSFSPATYRLTVQGWRRAIDINPACALYARIATLTAQELRDAKTAGGAPLLGADYRTGAQAGSVDALLQSMQKAAAIVTGKGGGRDGVWLVDEGQAMSSRVDPASLPDGYAWGLAADGQGALRALDAEAARRLAGQAGGASAGAFGVNLSISDIWESFLSGAKKAVSFIIRKAADVVEFICEVGGRIGRFIVRTVEEIGAFFKWAWEAIKTAAEDAWNFLKFLFDWGDIIAVRDKLKEMIDDQLRGMTTQILGLKDRVGPTFDAGLKAVREMAAQQGLAPSAESLRKPGDGSLKKAEQSNRGVKESAVSSGPGAWIMDQFAALSNALITIEMPPSSAPDIDLGAIFSRQLERLTDLCSTIGGDVGQIFEGKSPSLSDLDLEKIKRLVIAVTLRIAEGAIAVTRDVTFLLIDLLASLVDIFRRMLFARVRIPLIEKLWELATGEKIDASFSIIDVTLLPAAVLGTITFKLVFPRQDIKEVLTQRLPAGEVFGAQSSGLMTLLYFIKDVAGTFLSFVSVTMDAVPAMAEQVTQSATSKWEWFCWSASVATHVLGVKTVTSKWSKSKVVRDAEGLIWIAGAVQLAARYGKLAAAPMAAASYSTLGKGIAALEVVCAVIKVVAKTSAWVADRDGTYAPLELVQFYAATITKGAMNAARLDDDPASRGIIVVCAMAGGLFLDLGCGLTYNCLSYTKSA